MIDTADCSAEAAEVGIPRIRKQTSSPRSIWHIPHWWAHYTLSAVSSRKTFLQTETVGDCTAVCLAVLVVVLLGSNGYPASNILLQLPDHRYGNVVTTVLQMVIRSTKYLTVCFFCLGLSPLKRHLVRWQNFVHRCIQPYAKHLLGFMSKGFVVTKKWHFSKKYLHVGQQFLSGDGSVSWLAGCSQGRPWPRPVLLIALLLIAQAACGAAGWLAGCMQGHHSDLASVSLSDWP